MSKTSWLVIVLLVAIIALLSWMLFAQKVEAPTTVLSGDTASGADTAGGTGDISAPAPSPLHEKITLSSPKPGAAVGKSFTISGKAPGNWFFEASAPYMITTPGGDKIAQGALQTTEEWMTTKLVGFTANVTVAGSYTGPATLVLLKDNPSGLPENDDSLEVPITIQ